MGCDQYREALSADLDGEPPGVPEDALSGHLSGCPGCRELVRASRPGHPAGPVGAGDADSGPRAGRARGAAGGLARRRRVFAGARAALVVVAFLQALLAWSGALTGQDDMATGHVAHEVGAWNLALAVAFLMVATRPKAADALIAPVGVFVAVLAVVAASDAAADDLALGRLARPPAGRHRPGPAGRDQPDRAAAARPAGPVPPARPARPPRRRGRSGGAGTAGHPGHRGRGP